MVVVTSTKSLPVPRKIIKRKVVDIGLHHATLCVFTLANKISHLGLTTLSAILPNTTAEVAVTDPTTPQSTIVNTAHGPIWGVIYSDHHNLGELQFSHLALFPANFMYTTVHVSINHSEPRREKTCEYHITPLENSHTIMCIPMGNI
jgi:hypothetical protein